MLTEKIGAEFARAAREDWLRGGAFAEPGAEELSETPCGHGTGISVVGISGPHSISCTIQTNDDDRSANMLAFTEAGLLLFKKALQVQ